ncbi:two-component sensor histidine kinase [Roseovarius halotolerans]|uniref:histidine kinase n=1 Tax=Roseovarius halotolerans TaxID=505353 RepID=A0A1X6ZMD0_9RHOB|nr:histidine kinase dimerization/phosphoacceptor domain -containing protein [Roseovarius halotolerans]RKT28186.1 two-component sensor histidine kinase [Roseovarius halotolerans]SLN56028.1 putative sensor histidine kinase pdtaS [Roseovarius halotolerans]
MSEPPPRRKFKPGLAVLLALVLSIAILPLGLISVYQTLKVLEERRSLSETALLEQTQQAASASREVIGSAVSAAEALALTVSAFRGIDGPCDKVMRRIVEQSPNYMFAGFVDDELQLVCTSRGEERDLSGLDIIRTQLTSPDTEIQMQPLSFLGGPASVNVMVPVFDEAQFMGKVLIAVPITALNRSLTGRAPDVDLVLFQSHGEIIATEDFTDDRRAVLPQRTTLEELAERPRHTFREVNRAGMTRDFAVVAIVDGSVFALGSWAPRSRSLILPGYEEAFALYFPIIMWVTAIGVAYVGVHRLVIRHIRRLRSWMRLYAAGRADLEHARLNNAPEELEVVAEAFRAMTRRLDEQDRRREEDLQEKTVLLREVHHRVKNNLQLISSIMNMQIRAARSGEAKHLLRRVQDRVMALSAIHRYLYLARKLSMVRADKLLDEIIQQLVIVGTLDETGQQINVSTEFDPVEVDPDQSVPLSLLAAEAAMNAVKYSGVVKGDDAWINIALKKVENDELCLSVVNSRAPAGEEDAEGDPDGSGLGSRLIESFVSQLNGTLDIDDLPTRFELHVTFPRVWPDIRKNDE